MSAGRSFVTYFKSDASGFTKGVNEMQDKLKGLNTALKNNQKEQKEASKNITSAEKEIAKINKQIEKNGKATEEQEKQLAQLNQRIKDEKERIEELKLAQGQLLRQIDETNNKIQEQKKALQNLEKSLDDTKKYATEVATEFGAMGAAAVAAVAALYKFTADAALWADDLNTLSSVTGISTDELQKFAYASDLIDVSIDTLSGSLTKLTKNMQTASENTKSTAAKTFKELGISIEDSTGKLKDRQEVFYEAIAALGKIADETERDIVAMNLFGKSATDLNPLIKGGAEDLKRLGDEAERAGLILDETALTQLNDINDKIDILKAKGNAIEKLAATQLTPTVDGLLDVANEFFDEVNEKIQNGELEKYAKEMGELIKNAAVNLKNVIEWCWKYKDVISAVVVAMTAFKVSMSIANLVNSLVIGFKALKTVTESETLSMTALNTVMNANPIGLIVSLAAALTSAFASLAIATNTTADSFDNANSSADTYRSTLQELRKSESDTIASAESEVAVINSLAEHYEKLRSKTDKTQIDMYELSAVAEQLAGKLGITTDELRAQTGEYKELSQEVEKYTQKILQQAQLKAVQDSYTEALKRRNEAEIEVLTLRDEIAEKSDLEDKELFEKQKQLSALIDKYYQTDKVVEIYGKKLNDIIGTTTAVSGAVKTENTALQELKDKTEKLNKALDEQKTKSQNLKSSLSELAGAYDKLNQGQKLDLDTILNLIDKYPEYASRLLSAADNADAQKQAIELLFNAKKNEYILTQQSAIDNIKASNDETTAVIDDIKKQIEAYEQLAKAKNPTGFFTTDSGFSSQFDNGFNDLFKPTYAVDNTEQKLLSAKQTLEELQKQVRDGTLDIKNYEEKIKAVQNITIDTLKISSSGKSSGNSSSNSGSGKSDGDQKDIFTKSGYGVTATGDTYAKAYMTWVDRLKSLGKITAKGEIFWLEKLKERTDNSAEEIYQIDLKLYQARQKLADDSAKSLADIEKKRQDELQEKLNFAKAAYERLVNGRIESLQKEAQTAKDTADAEIAALDKVLAKRKQAKSDEDRQKKIDYINAQLRYKQLDKFSRNELQRQKQDLLNEQAEVNFERNISAKQQAISRNATLAQNKTQQAINGLNSAKSQFADHIAYLSGSQTYDQRVANNTVNQNINIVQNSLTTDQLYRKFLKETGLI